MALSFASNEDGVCCKYFFDFIAKNLGQMFDPFLMWFYAKVFFVSAILRARFAPTFVLVGAMVVIEFFERFYD